MSKITDDNLEPRCSFCGKPQSKVSKLIAGAGGFICNECIEMCNEILEEEGIAMGDEPEILQEIRLYPTLPEEMPTKEDLRANKLTQIEDQVIKVEREIVNLQILLDQLKDL